MGNQVPDDGSGRRLKQSHVCRFNSSASSSPPATVMLHSAVLLSHNLSFCVRAPFQHRQRRIHYESTSPSLRIAHWPRTFAVSPSSRGRMSYIELGGEALEGGRTRLTMVLLTGTSTHVFENPDRKGEGDARVRRVLRYGCTGVRVEHAQVRSVLW